MLIYNLLFEYMKKAFVNCRIMPWWVLNVFQDMIEKEEYSEAKVFTLFSDRSEISVWEKKLQVITALPKRLNKIFLYFSKNKIKILSSIFDYRNLMMFYPFFMKVLSRKIKKYSPEKIVISSFAIAKNISVPNIKKKLYLHSPMQYIWSHYDEYTHKLSWFKLALFKAITPRLRKRDKRFTQFDEVEFNSKYTANLAKELYWITWKVVYPKIDPAFRFAKIVLQPNNYYIYVWRTVKFVKEVDKIIKLFNEIKKPLLIMWSGPDEMYLKSIAWDNVIFIWRIENPEEKMKIISESKWLVNITKESFWICTMEALLCWVPVFGFDDWASVELIDSESWILVTDKKHKTLVSNFKKFVETNWNRENIQKRARKIISNH